jgi:hypothetical protein
VPHQLLSLFILPFLFSNIFLISSISHIFFSLFLSDEREKKSPEDFELAKSKNRRMPFGESFRKKVEGKKIKDDEFIMSKLGTLIVKFHFKPFCCFKVLFCMKKFHPLNKVATMKITEFSFSRFALAMF